MWIADNWKDYELIDASNGERLERWGQHILVRPDPQVIWKTPRTSPVWKRPEGRYSRSHTGGGSWDKGGLPASWDIRYGSLTFHVKPMNFKHTGLFPEQAANWDWMQKKIREADRPISVLNLFAYTGGRERLPRGCREGHGRLGEGQCRGVRRCGRERPLDRGRLRQIRRAGDPPRTQV